MGAELKVATLFPPLYSNLTSFQVAGAPSATLNQLIALLVSDTKYDTEYVSNYEMSIVSNSISSFMKMFITTYESFTNPYILLEKLTQRYCKKYWSNNIVDIYIFAGTSYQPP